jgi:Flp pilus assembly protein TadG
MKCLKNEKGQSLVEFALILPLVLLLLMGIVEFGVMINTYLKIENASREAARSGIVGSTDAEINTLVTSISPGLDSSRLKTEVTPQQSSRKAGNTLTVRVSYEYRLTVPIISNLFNKAITLKSQTSMRIE